LDDEGPRPVKRELGCLAGNYDASAAALKAATRAPKPLLDKLENTRSCSAAATATG